MQAVQCPFRAGVSGTLAVFRGEDREKSHALSELVSTGIYIIWAGPKAYEITLTSVLTSR